MAKRLIEVLKSETQRLLAAVHIFEQSIIVSRFARDGSVQRRLTSAAELAALFGSQVAGQVNWMTLDKSVVACGIDSDGGQRYLVVRAAKKTVIRLEFGKTKKKITIFMPKLLAEVVAKQTKEGRQFASVERVFAFGGTLKKTTQLYVPPVPNMYQDGKICMGNVNTAAIGEGVKTAGEFFEEAFIKSIFTDHLLGSPLTAAAAKKYRNILDLLKKTGGKIALRQLGKVGTYGKLY